MTTRLQLLLIPIALALCGLLAACGHPSTHAPGRQRAPFVCHPKSPPQMGECVRQELEYDSGHKVEPPKFAPTQSRVFHTQGIDISRWQGHPAFRELHRQGIRFVIVQGADNVHESNPFFDAQVREAHEAGMQIGVYIYVEGGDSTAQANALLAAARRERRLISLGAWIDTEQPNAYGHACGIARVLRRHFFIVGDYGSIGTVPASMNACAMLDWPASWGSSLARPAPGFSFASMKMRQWCGTCRLLGVGEIDRDEDLGVLALSHVRPKPKPRTHAQLVAYLAQLDRLLGSFDRRRNPHGHNCAKPPYRHAYPSRRYNPLCARWAREAGAAKKALRR